MHMATLTLILSTALLGFLLYSILTRWWRRPNSSPLPPGPRPWPIVGNLPQLGPKPHQSMAVLAKVHGPVMHLKMGPAYVVVAASASVAEQFLKVHDANFSSRPSTGAKTDYDDKDLVFAPYGPRWRLLRKICALHIFSAKALDNFRHVRQEEVGILSGALASAGQTPVRLGQMLNVCATNAIARVTLGKRLVGHGSGGGDEKAKEFKALVVELLQLGGAFKIGDYIPALERFDLRGIVAKQKKMHERFDRFLTAIVNDHKIDGRRGANVDVDLLSTLMISRKDGDESNGGKLTDTEIKALLRNLFVAGTDTTASTVEWAIAELIRHPKILAQAQQELDLVVGDNRFVTESDLPRLVYLQAVIKENFRLHPSTPLSLPRVAEEKCEINGYHIPKGSTLLVNVWAISRDPDEWSEPLEFRPDRFLPGGEKPNVDLRGNDFEMIPFGAGRRICPGMALGIRMVQLLTATLIHAYDFELSNGLSARELNMEEAYGFTLQRAEPLVVHPKPRLAPHVYHA